MLAVAMYAQIFLSKCISNEWKALSTATTYPSTSCLFASLIQCSHITLYTGGGMGVRFETSVRRLLKVWNSYQQKYL